jgi:hypothetical protein
VTKNYIEEATVMRGALGLCVLSGLSALVLAACVGAPEAGEVAADQDISLEADVAPTGKGIRTIESAARPEVVQVPLELDNGALPEGQAKPTGGATVSITNHGGPVMLSTTHAYVIWYGNWTGNTGTTIIPAYLSSIGGSPHFNINTTYYQGTTTKSYVSNSHTLGGQTTVAYPYGTALTDANIKSIVSDAIVGGKLPSDTHGVYFVLTSADVNETSGFCTQYCGWHTHGTIGGADIKYSVVGNAARCITSCAAQSTGPNGNAGVDGMLSVITHELEETVTDPDLNAWYDSGGAENGDKCAWTFGTESTAANGSKYNMTLGGKQYLIQRNWDATLQACAMSR